MAKLFLVICALLVVLVCDLRSDAVAEPKHFDDCGLFCQPSWDAPQSSAKRHKRRLRSAHLKLVHSRHKRQASTDDQPLSKDRAEEVTLPAPAQNAPANPAARPEVKVEPVGLQNVVQVVARLTAESKRSETSVQDDVKTTGGLLKNDPRVALLITRDGILTISDLAGKSVAIDDDLSQSSAAIRTALVAGGAPEIQMSESRTKVMDRLLRDEVPGAVIGLVLRDQLENIPELEGYRVFRVPLSPN